jgi:hypothetical protein
MIRKLFNHAHVLWGTGSESDLPEEAIAAYIDAGGTIVLAQRDAEIVVSKQTIPDLVELLKKMQRLAS